MSMSSAMRPPAGKCPWPRCGHRATVEVFITIPGTPPRAGSVGRSCVGHAVICGIQTQTRYHGRLWHLPVALGLTHDPSSAELLPRVGLPQRERHRSAPRTLAGHDQWGPGDPRAQVRPVFENLEMALAVAGTSFDQIVSSRSIYFPLKKGRPGVGVDLLV
jgi:hypothetical protein